MIELPQTQSLMAGPLGGWLRQQQDMRSKARALASRRVWTSALVLGPLLLAGWIALSFPFEVKAWASGIALTLAWAWTRGPVKAAKK